MKRAMLVGFTVFAVLLLATAAYAEKKSWKDDLYFSGNLGVTKNQDADFINADAPDIVVSHDFSNGWLVSGAVGTKLNNIRVEGELGYRTADFDTLSIAGAGITTVSGEMTVINLMANGYVDFALESKFTPFVMVGVGFANVDVADYGFSGNDADDTVFAYQAGIGVGYAFMENITVDLAYKYMWVENPEFDKVEAEYRSCNFMAGVRYNF